MNISLYLLTHFSLVELYVEMGWYLFNIGIPARPNRYFKGAFWWDGFSEKGGYPQFTFITGSERFYFHIGSNARG